MTKQFIFTFEQVNAMARAMEAQWQAEHDNWAKLPPGNVKEQAWARIQVAADVHGQLQGALKFSRPVSIQFPADPA